MLKEREAENYGMRVVLVAVRDGIIKNFLSPLLELQLLELLFWRTNRQETERHSLPAEKTCTSHL